MKRNIILKNAIGIVAAAAMVANSAGMVYAINLNDITNHWAEQTIITWVEEGVVKGYPDASFKPNNSITRAEFMSLIDKAFELTEEEDINYSDVSEDAWYYNLVRRAQAKGYVTGYDDSTMKPENPITRQEAATIITRIMSLEENTEAISNFKDQENFAQWSKGFIGAVSEAKYMVGDDKGNFRSTDNITRAEAVTVLNNIFYGQNIDEDNEEDNITVPEVAQYGFVVTGDGYTIGELTEPADEDFEGKEFITVKLEESVAGTAFEGKVRIAPLAAEGIQLWAKDSNNNWYDINQVGWGPVEGFEIDLDAETEIYVFISEDASEDISITFKLVDANDPSNIIAEGTKVLTFEDETTTEDEVVNEDDTETEEEIASEEDAETEEETIIDEDTTTEDDEIIEEETIVEDNTETEDETVNSEV